MFLFFNYSHFLLVYFLKTEKEGMELGMWGGGEDLGGDRGGKPSSEYTA